MAQLQRSPGDCREMNYNTTGSDNSFMGRLQRSPGDCREMNFMIRATADTNRGFNGVPAIAGR